MRAEGDPPTIEITPYVGTDPAGKQLGPDDRNVPSERHVPSEPHRPVETPTGPTASVKVWRWVAPVSLILVILVAFMPALTASFVNWDDDDLLFNETRYRTVNLDTVGWMFTTSYAGHFQPLTWLSYSLDWALWKRESFGYHLTSVLLHAMTAVGFYFVARRLLLLGLGGKGKDETGASGQTVSGEDGRLRDAARAEARGSGVSARADPGPRVAPSRARARGSGPVRGGISNTTMLTASAAVAAALFAVHPLRVESVAWVAERRDVLSGFFYILALWFYLRHAAPISLASLHENGEGSSHRSRRAYVAALVCCVLSLLAKASAVTMPLVLLVLDVFPLRRLGRSRMSDRGATGRVWLEKVPFLVVCLAAGGQALIAQWEQGALYPLAEHDAVARLAQACYGLFFYVWKTLWPTNLAPLYGIPARPMLLGPMLWGSAAAVAALVVIAVLCHRRLPAVTAALAFYLIQVSPVLGFAQSGPQLVADRYSYLPCLGFAVLAGAGLLWILSHCRPSGEGGTRALTALAVGGVLAALADGTFRQSDVWRSSLTLWAHGVVVSPDSSVAHVNFADALAEADVPLGAVHEYERALELNPRDAIAAHHLADVLMRLGDSPRAAMMYRRALELRPDLAVVLPKLAHALVASGRPHEAAVLLRNRLQLSPGDLEAAEFLADLLATYPDESVRSGEEAERLARRVNEARGGRDGAVLLTWASALAEAGRFEESIAAAEKALSIADDTEDRRLAGELQRRLELFRRHKPYHFGD